tara:strand:+ start:502 stop:1191 length:690 start_codon:yes stop_codon:yes gene_type:complete
VSDLSFSEKYINNSHQKAIKEQRQFQAFNNVDVFVKDALPEDFDLKYVLHKVETLIPDYLMSNVDSIYVGQFDEFTKRQVNALYKDGALYITNIQDNEEDMVDDVVHEISHSIEEFAGEDIYGDGRVENEFLGKRQKLFYILREEGYNVELKDFLNSNYDKNFDMFLYQDVGYELMVSFTMGLFLSSYSVTSLREYFAIGFEYYYLKDRKHIENISPILFEKLQYISSF